MMLVMITKKITTEKRPEVIFHKASRFVLVAGFVSVFVRDVSTEIKQLERGQYAWDDPEHDQIFQWENKTKQLQTNCHKNQLLPGDISFEEIPIPKPEFTRLMIVRVLVSGHESVVLMVLDYQPVIEVKGEQQGSYSSDEMIDFPVL